MKKLLYICRINKQIKIQKMKRKELTEKLESVIGYISNNPNLETETELLTNVLGDLVKSNGVSNNDINVDIEIVINVLYEQGSYEDAESKLCDVLNALRRGILEEIE